MVNTLLPTNTEVMRWLEDIRDPEIPVVSIREMGMLRHLAVQPDGAIEVQITPSYTACPAMSLIAQDIRALLHAKGFPEVTVRTVYTPAWSTDWLNEETKQKLRAYGIAPPVDSSCMNPLSPKAVNVACPHCGSAHTKLVSQFGSTPCKSLYTCSDCKEPFDYFKCH